VILSIINKLITDKNINNKNNYHEGNQIIQFRKKLGNEKDMKMH